MPRLFVAIDLPERILDDISSTYSAIPGARWMEENRIHITLRFIGEVDNESEDRIKRALSLVASPSFTLSLKGVGFFPPRGEPRIVWIGIKEKEEVIRLQAKIEHTITSLRFPPEERKFHPHITVARLNNSPHERVARYITDNSLFATESFAVSEFHLYSSILRREGAHYIREASFALGDANTLTA
jgi:RNA 2',3'-cyclic 3'-phosphodiesterase